MHLTTFINISLYDLKYKHQSKEDNMAWDLFLYKEVVE